MSLANNPIFLTHQRLVRRGGLLAPVLLAAVISLCFVANPLLARLNPDNYRGFYHESPQLAGLNSYGWLLGIEMIVLILGGFNRIAQSLSEDRKAGLWESNLLTPLRPQAIVAGYWLAPALREVCMAAVMAGAGLLTLLIVGLPWWLWLATQVLVISTALLAGLFGVLAGMVLTRNQIVPILLLLIFSATTWFAAPDTLVTNLILPVSGIHHLFVSQTLGLHDNSYMMDYVGDPKLFGWHVHPLLLTLVLQALLATFLWRALIRRTARPFGSLFLRWEAVTLFGLLAWVQNALLWSVWSGQFPAVNGSRPSYIMQGPFLPFLQAGEIFVGLALLGGAAAMPEKVRLQALRQGGGNLGVALRQSALPLALILAGIAALGLLSQIMFNLNGTGLSAFLVASINLLEIYVIFALMVEFCRLNHQRRAMGFMILWIFVLVVIPLILGALFESAELARLSLVAPGFIALADPEHADWTMLHWAIFLHFVVAVLFYLAWSTRWNRLFQQTAKSPAPPGMPPVPPVA